MEDEYGIVNEQSSCVPSMFRSFVCVGLSLLLGMHMYTYLWEHPASDPGAFSDVKQVVMQLIQGLSEVNRKHEQLQTEMQRLASALPGLAGRARDALGPSLRRDRGYPLDLHHYDHQVADYALESAGGKVLDTGDTVDHVTYESPAGWVLYVVTSLVCKECLGARAMLQPAALPGECWAFKGSRGQATIRLLGLVHVTGFSLEHIPAHIAPTREISSAPRVFQIEGLESRTDPHPHDFGTYQYEKEGKPIQYFEVMNPSPKSYSLVRLRVRSNWGHPVYTCVYRLRVHGELDMPRDQSIRDDGDVRIDSE